MAGTISEADIFRHNQPFLRQKGRLKFLATDTATICFSVAGDHRQICQVGFNSDGSIRVAWPYLAVKQGILALCEVPLDAKSHRIELQEQGKFSSQLVKLSHHASGRAHFSLSGKTTSEIGRQSFPLTGPIGRIFELTAILPHGFKSLARLKRGRAYVNFTGGSKFPEAIQIRGEWRRKTDTVANSWPKGSDVGPVTMRRHRATGELAPAAFIGPPLGCTIQSHLLWVTCHPAPPPTGATRPGIILLAAFDEHESTSKNASVPVHLNKFLSAMFPTDSSEDVVKAIGSIDITAEPPDAPTSG